MTLKLREDSFCPLLFDFRFACRDNTQLPVSLWLTVTQRPDLDSAHRQLLPIRLAHPLKKNFYFFEKIAIWRVGLKIDIGHQIEILVGRSWQINFRGPDYDDEI